MRWQREALTLRTSLALILLSLVAVWLADAIRLGRWQGPVADRPLAVHMEAVTSSMRNAIAAVAELRRQLGVPLDPANDPNGTGLIGVEYSRITTTIGHLEAKRTSTNPQFAGLILRLLHEAGVGAGDAVAIGASGSFPALILATILAVEELDAEPVVISSLGASAWGANHPDFTWGDIEAGLHARGVIPSRSVAVSMGGDRDTGFSMEPDSLELLERALARTGLPRIDEPDLQANVEARLAAFADGAGDRPITAFVNVGGNWAHLGEGIWQLSLGPGLHREPPTAVAAPAAQDRGVLYRFLMEGVPVIHLLNVRQLAFDYGLPVDPVPLPAGIGLLAAEALDRTLTWPFIVALLIAKAVATTILLARDGANRRYRREF